MYQSESKKSDSHHPTLWEWMALTTELQRADITTPLAHGKEGPRTLTTVFLVGAVSTVILPVTSPAKRDAAVICTPKFPRRFACHRLCKSQSLQILQKPMVKECQSSTGSLEMVWRLCYHSLETPRIHRSVSPPVPSGRDGQDLPNDLEGLADVSPGQAE